MHRKFQDWLRYRHITNRTESENSFQKAILYTLHVGFPPVWGDLDICIFGPGALVNSH